MPQNSGGIIMGETEQKMDIQAMWESLGISNDFLFGKVMQDMELCKGLLEIMATAIPLALDGGLR